MILVIFRRIWGALKPFYKKIIFDNIFAIAGQSAFFLILSAVPLLMFSVSILQSLHLSTETLGDFLGDTYSSTQVSEWFKSLNNMYKAPTSISVITLIATLWSASKGMHAITNGLNRVHNTYESRTWLSLRLHAMLHTFVFLMIIAVTIGVMVFGKGLGNQIEPYLKKLPGYLVAIYSLRYIIVFLYQVFLFALLYRNTPNLTREKRKEYGF
ncbi:MAG: YihY/virulence factor BrkB family protein, partial [Ruminococcus sp.]|nr:YihY/virulence factor BrkB family protein [Ruminococcus sp.]